MQGPKVDPNFNLMHPQASLCMHMRTQRQTDRQTDTRTHTHTYTQHNLAYFEKLNYT
jgi:hypothetical protein